MRPYGSVQLGSLTSNAAALPEVNISTNHHNTYTWSVAKRLRPSAVSGKQFSR